MTFVKSHLLTETPMPMPFFLPNATYCTIGGFNVSNLMRIKWRMINHSPFDSYRNSKKSIKLKSPTVQVPNSKTKKAHRRHPFPSNDKTFCTFCSFDFLFSFFLSLPINFLFDWSILPAHFSFYAVCFNCQSKKRSWDGYPFIFEFLSTICINHFYTSSLFTW